MRLAERPTASLRERLRQRVRFDRSEFSGAFGDIGTDFPLLMAMISAASLPTASVLVLFGGMQLLTGFLYGLPMPVQPLKAMAVLVISQKATAPVLYGGGLAIGAVMLVLAATGALEWLGRLVLKSVIRGIQLGLGLQLALLALRNFLPAEGAVGYGLAGVGFLLGLVLLGNRRAPAALLILLVGVVYALAFRVNLGVLAQGVGVALPRLMVPSPTDIVTGLLVLAIPQLGLSLGNSLLATRQLVRDLFPRKALTLRKIGLTYSLMNLVNPFFGGVPTCHGSGGLVGHYTFGARTGGSVVIYGLFYLILGLFFSGSLHQVVLLFPKPVLGVILLFEGWALMRLVRDVMGSPADAAVTFLVGVVAAGVPYGFAVGLVGGTALAYWLRHKASAESGGQ